MSFATAIAGAVATVKAAAGVSVTYRRGSDTVAITAIKSAVSVDLDGGDRIAVKAERVDWIVEETDLVLAGAQTEPIEGDEIDETAGGQTETYVAVPVGTTGCFRHCDGTGAAFRIHTKLAGVA